MCSAARGTAGRVAGARSSASRWFMRRFCEHAMFLLRRHLRLDPPVDEFLVRTLIDPRHAEELLERHHRADPGRTGHRRISPPTWHGSLARDPRPIRMGAGSPCHFRRPFYPISPAPTMPDGTLPVYSSLEWFPLEWQCVGADDRRAPGRVRRGADHAAHPEPRALTSGQSAPSKMPKMLTLRAEHLRSRPRIFEWEWATL